MKEPQRLLEQGATDAGRALLDSARADGPPEGAGQRMLVALAGLTVGGGSLGSQGLGSAMGSPVPSTSAAVAAHSLRLGALAKVGLVALVGVGALGGGVLIHFVAAQRSVPSETPGARAPVMQEKPAGGPTEIPAAREPPGAASRVSAPSLGSAPALRHRPAEATDESLSAETRVLDVARAAVDAHNPAAAQRALDGYAQRFPQGHLKPEAMVLRLAVLVRQGKGAEARSLAAQLLAGDAYKAYEYRIRSLLRETGE